MKTKMVLRGKNAQGEEVLLAFQLRPETGMVDVWVFAPEVSTPELEEQLFKHWREDKEVTFPEPYTHEEKELSLTESLLPEGITTDDIDKIQLAQTEWQFVVLSHKLEKSYQQELDELKARIEALQQFDKQVWEELKAFWDKLREQVNDRNLLHRHANSLRDQANALFAKMKELRAALDAEFRIQSREKLEAFQKRLQDITEKAEKGLNLPALFEELKQIQNEYHNTRMIRDHRNTLWDQLNAAFRLVKEKRFGKNAGNNSPLERLKRRYNGLLAAIEKMERSIRRDKEDLKFQQHKLERSEGQLETQLRQAKIKMLEERVRSKEEKLSEMLQTKKELEARLEKLQRQEAKKQQQTASTTASSPQTGEEESPTAAEAPSDAVPETQTTSGNVGTGTSLLEKIEDLAEDAIDTAKAVASVAADKIQDTVEELKEEAEEIKEKVEEKIEKIIPPEKVETIKEEVDEAVENAVDLAKAAAVVVTTKVEEAIDHLKKKEKETPQEQNDHNSSATHDKDTPATTTSQQQDDATDATSTTQEKAQLKDNDEAAADTNDNTSSPSSAQEEKDQPQ